MTVVRLDMHELADEWQELLDEREQLQDELCDEPDHLSTAEAIESLTEDMEKYEALCAELGVSPVEPDTLRNVDEDFIHEDSFEEFAREFAEEVCALPEGWPVTCIDWSRAADELRMDYTTITYDGEDYYTR